MGLSLDSPTEIFAQTPSSEIQHATGSEAESGTGSGSGADSGVTMTSNDMACAKEDMRTLIRQLAESGGVKVGVLGVGRTEVRDEAVGFG